MKNIHLNSTNIAVLPQLCPIQSSIAFCLNQLRQAQISFLNLGNIVVCPEQRLILIFQAKYLKQIQPLHEFA